jgi:putative oxidoreductase
MDSAKKYGLLALKALAALAFIGAGSMKLIGNPDMIAVFDAVGVGQWFRYVTGLIEVGSAVLLFVPGMQLIGAGLLAATMVGAILAHLFILGPSLVPALVLLVIVSVIGYAHRP